MQDHHAESTPLLALKDDRATNRARRYFLQKVQVQNAYVPLLLCCFITGLIDAGSYNAWTVFMGMQTGAFATFRTWNTETDCHQATPSSWP